MDKDLDELLAELGSVTSDSPNPAGSTRPDEKAPMPPSLPQAPAGKFSTGSSGSLGVDSGTTGYCMGASAGKTGSGVGV